MLIYNDTFTASITLNHSSEAISLAARDLRRDLLYLSSKADGFAVRDGGDILISVTDTLGEEDYKIEITEDKIYIVGGGVLGAVFGIYAFSREILGFTPMFRVTDIMPKKRQELDVKPQILVSPLKKPRFRGWFLNDEDLLTDFRCDGGKRNIDYPFYQNVMHTDVLDMILECALRLEINLVIPSSFINITNPDEERLIEAVCRRGLYVSQHHIEPLGVSYFGADNYMRKHGYKDETVSFITNKHRMVEIWRLFAKKWAKYGDRVIWQLGLRGKADKAVWQTDPSVPMDNATRGSIISDAIATQYEIVRDELKRSDFNSTVTLWMEGARLYGEGHLRVPDNSIVIFSDIGFNQMFGGDFYSTPRKPDQKYGIYYHVGYWGEGPHLCEGTHPDKIGYCYREAQKYNSLYYSILNVSNLRPLHLGAELVSRALASPENYDGYRELEDILKPIFGHRSSEITEIYREYFGCFADLGSIECRERCDRHNFYYVEYSGTAFQELCANDGSVHEFGQATFDVSNPRWADKARAARLIDEGRMLFGKLVQKMDAILPTLDGCAKEYFRKFTRFGAVYMEHLSAWAVAKYEMQFASGKEKLAIARRAESSLLRILDERRVLEEGIWNGWHRGERKIGIEKFKSEIQRIIQECENDR